MVQVQVHPRPLSDVHRHIEHPGWYTTAKVDDHYTVVIGPFGKEHAARRAAVWHRFMPEITQASITERPKLLPPDSHHCWYWIAERTDDAREIGGPFVSKRATIAKLEQSNACVPALSDLRLAATILCVEDDDHVKDHRPPHKK